VVACWFGREKRGVRCVCAKRPRGVKGLEGQRGESAVTAVGESAVAHLRDGEAGQEVHVKEVGTPGYPRTSVGAREPQLRWFLHCWNLEGLRRCRQPACHPLAPGATYGVCLLGNRCRAAAVDCARVRHGMDESPPPRRGRQLHPA